MRTVLLLSGGVDSSVALALLREAGREVEAVYLKVWLEGELADLADCPWKEDLELVRRVCDRLDVPLRVLSLQREYHEAIVERVTRELLAGRTPSPDVLCNREIKFGVALERLGPQCEWIASGHYARVFRERDGTVTLQRALDPVKDQTYFLSQLRAAQLARCEFPIGRFRKREVRELAHRFDLPTKDRPDSQGICFLGGVKYREFVAARLGRRRGEIVEHGTGRRLGWHDGYWFVTLGQRHGLGLSGGPWYVVDKDPEANLVVVAHRQQLETVARRRFRVPRPHWIGPSPHAPPTRVKVRHGPREARCETRIGTDGGLEVEIAEPDPGLASGQYAVFYEGARCLGGGPIEVSVTGEAGR